MKLISHGAAREVTGYVPRAHHQYQSRREHWLLDCGLFQGSRKRQPKKMLVFTFRSAHAYRCHDLKPRAHGSPGRIPLLYKTTPGRFIVRMRRRI